MWKLFVYAEMIFDVLKTDNEYSKLNEIQLFIYQN